MSHPPPAALAAFPKARPPLPEAIRAIYVRQYQENRRGATPASSLAQRAEGWLHRRVADDLGAGGPPRSTLEIGAGTLNQLRHEPEAAAAPYDIVEPFAELYEGAPELARVRRVHADIAEVHRESRYDRITSVATFEHICDLPAVVARAGMLLAPGGSLRVAIPSEGRLLWGLGWRLTTGLEFRVRHGLAYGDLLRHEHVNTAAEIEGVLRYFFGRVESRFLGPTRALSLYQFHACSGPRLDRCEAYLAGVHHAAVRTL